MKKIIQLLSVSASCIALAACGASTTGGVTDLSVTQLHAIEGIGVINSLVKKSGSVSVNTVSKTATLTYNGKTYSDLALSTTTPGVYGSVTGDLAVLARSINVGSESGLWQLSLIDNSGAGSVVVAYAVQGTPTADLPTGKSEYIGSFSGFFSTKNGNDVGAVANETTGSLALQVDFGAGTFTGKTISHLDVNLKSVVGSIEITNGKVNGGKATYDIATKDSLMANLGIAGGAMSGSGDARFYKDGNASGPNFLGTGSLENTSALGVFGFSTGYHGAK